MKFDTLKDDFTIPAAEDRILRFWNSSNIFHKAKELARDRPHFVFYEGPPTANGPPGIHHIISRTVKDLICRYKAMCGYRVDRKAGWDTHGLPVEIDVEKQLQLDSKAKVLEYGIDAFNQKCRESVFRYLADWDAFTERIGYWLDLDDAYVTLTNEYIETVWWILKNFFDRGLIYRGHKTVPFCPRCETGLSSHEVAQGYELMKDPSIFVKVKAADGDFSYLIWTTTPWTLPSNAALCMRADADYVMVEHQGEHLVLAEALVLQVFGESKRVIERFKGAAFERRRYLPLFDTFKDQTDKAHYVILGDFVTLEDGTGIVHIAPGFGADDYEIGRKYGLPVLQAIEANGVFKDFAGPYAGMFIKDADPIIINDLKQAGALLKKELYEHNYPFCWRCASPLIYIARQSWYLKTTDFRDQLIKNNNEINWQPDEIRTGRMLNWLENNVDWALSRERFWGTPIPIWVCDNPGCGKVHAVGSVEQLRREGIDVPDELDLHKPMMDTVKLACDCGHSMSRIPEVVDVWFDSGAMPYAQWHYPFENQEEFELKFPCDFISEAVDQTRGWFYSLLAISTLLFDKPAFKNVIVLEHIQDREGKKMSKSKGNVVDPFVTASTYGADPTRWYLVATSNPWLPIRFDTHGLAEVVRKYFDTLRNTYSFFALYANIDDIANRADQAGMSIESFLKSEAGDPEQFDRWIVSRFNSVAKLARTNLDRYEITRPCRAIQQFVIEELSNWYVRINRRRFWAEGDDASKMRANLTLYRMLTGVCRLTAPMTPFISELLWTELAGVSRLERGLAESVHFTSYPEPDEALIDTELEEGMTLVQRVVSLGRAARARTNLKVRQPLPAIMISVPGKSDTARVKRFTDVIESELNVKSVETVPNVDQCITYSAKLNFKNAGPRLGGRAKTVAAQVARLDSDTVRAFAESGELRLESDKTTEVLTSEDIEVVRHDVDGYAVEREGAVAVALVTHLDRDLVYEGFAREIVNKVQNMRKAAGFDVTDNITISVVSSEEVRAAAAQFNDFIRRETLAKNIEFADERTSDNYKEWNINGVSTAIAVAKV